jgi:hypothetical protein
LSQPSTAWELRRFVECLDRWAEQEGPSSDLVIRVALWAQSRMDNPYEGVRREVRGFDGAWFDNLWYGSIPGSHHQGKVVTCSYFIFERERYVQCATIATLSRPF